MLQNWYSVEVHKPHIPWNVPQKYYDLYPLDAVELAVNQAPPTAAPTVAMQNVLSGYWSDTFTEFAALRANGTITKVTPADNTTLDPYWQRRTRQAYWAALSYTDDNIGAVIAALKDHDFWHNTIVVLWSDHGYQLGENDQWEKQSNFEQATRIPVMIRVPGAKGNGRHTSAIWEAVDLFPTVADLAMGDVPPVCPPTLATSRTTMLCTDGKSAAALLDAPDSNWGDAAFSQITRGALVNGMHANLPEEVYMGYSVRTPSWRYTEWVKFDNTTGIADWTTLYGQELYAEVAGEQCRFDQDHVNVVSNPANAAIIDKHSAMLRRSLPQMIV
jgi:arylsulfatase A-like enzyme